MVGDRPFPTDPASQQAVGYPVSRLLALPYPVRNLVRRWRGLLGMMLGVGISLSIVMTLQAMSKANVDLYTYDFLRSGADLYVVQEGGTLIPVLPSDTPGSIKHGRQQLAAVRGTAGVDAAFGVMSWPLERESPGPKRRDQPTELISTMGVEGDPTRVPHALALREGRWLRRSNEIVVGWKLSREKKLGVGDTLRLSGRDFTVVGIGKLRGAGMGGESIAYMDYRTFQQRAGIGSVLSIIMVETRQPELARARLQERDALAVFDRAQLVQRAEEVNASAVVVYWVFNLLALSVGALFVSNMLGRSVAERRLEFATLRAIGIPTRTILLAVTSEAVLISLVAGLIAVVISLAMGAWLNALFAAEYGLEFIYSADVGTFALVFAMGLALGVISGLLPARQATRVDPVEVLREA